MKKKQWVGIVALIGCAFIALAMIACDGGNGGNSDPALPGNVAISVQGGDDPVIGVTLTALYTGGGAEATDIQWQWRRGTTNLGTAQTQVADTAGIYTVVASAVGFSSKTSNTITVTASGGGECTDDPCYDPNCPTHGSNVNDCQHGDFSEQTTPPTCIDPQYFAIVCDDCGEELEGHYEGNPAYHFLTLIIEEGNEPTETIDGVGTIACNRVVTKAGKMTEDFICDHVELGNVVIPARNKLFGSWEAGGSWSGTLIITEDNVRFERAGAGGFFTNYADVEWEAVANVSHSGLPFSNFENDPAGWAFTGGDRTHNELNINNIWGCVLLVLSQDGNTLFAERGLNSQHFTKSED
jgi:hypothetical protein